VVRVARRELQDLISAGSLPAPFRFCRQERRNWCWAACCSMALQCRGVVRSQCRVAGAGLGLADCCTRGSCDYACPLPEVEKVFRRNGLDGATGVAAPLGDGGELAAALAHGPVALGLQGRSANHMVLVLGGGRREEERFVIADPARDGLATTTFGELRRGDGGAAGLAWCWTWTHLR
jgi:hypothetical protein